MDLGQDDSTLKPIQALKLGSGPGAPRPVRPPVTGERGLCKIPTGSDAVSCLGFRKVPEIR